MHPEALPIASVAEIRATENPLIAAQAEPDGFMREAARAVATVAEQMLHPGARVLVLAGAGGNGGDGLYAGSMLIDAGFNVSAMLLGDRAHEPALAAFRASGGTLLARGGSAGEGEFDLVIDAIFGIGARGGLDEEVAGIVEKHKAARWLSVDVPSGVLADSGEAGAHVQADVTVTFGALRFAHAISPACGTVLLAPVTARLRGGEMASLTPNVAHPLMAWRAVHRMPTPPGMRTLPTPHFGSIEPGHSENKYSGGVVGILAGSPKYPGAGVLATSGAVQATPAMVRYVGGGTEVLRAHPEVVACRTLAECGRVQAWVFGPGVDDSEHLAALLARPEPLLIDADGLTHLAESGELREQLRFRAERGRLTVLTPHDGEFLRLFPNAPANRLEATEALARGLGCVVLRKGRITLISDGKESHSVDAGHSWLATPGSGDVLAGLAGAWLARGGADPLTLLAQAVAIHATASWLAAQTPYGPATAPAARIAEFIPQAVAKLSEPQR